MSDSLRALKDSELLSQTKSLVGREREITTQVLRHLEEIERRKLYADLRYSSLWEYCVRELKYSEAAANRRIQAMRLMREIPELGSKIESGALSLSNISQAQSYFRELKHAEPERVVRVEEKIEVLAILEDKSARESERILLELSPPSVLPRERERIVSPEHTEVKFLIDQALKTKLEEVRSLLGLRGQSLGLAELMLEMATLSTEKLKEKRFGKTRVAAASAAKSEVGAKQPNLQLTTSSENETLAQKPIASDVGGDESVSESSNSGMEARRSHYIPKAVKHEVWTRAGGQCTSCGSRHHLQFDHVQPLALGGDSSTENIQLLCSSCNLRRGVKTFGTRAMRRS